MIKLLFLLATLSFAVPINERVAVLENQVVTLQKQVSEQEIYISQDMRHKKDYSSRQVKIETDQKSEKLYNMIIDIIEMIIVGLGGTLLYRKGKK